MRQTTHRIRILCTAILGLTISMVILMPKTREKSDKDRTDYLNLNLLLAAQQREEKIRSKILWKTNHIVQEKFTWLLHNTTANQIFSPKINRTKHSVMIFLHIPRTAGMEIAKCISNMRPSLTLFPDLTDQQRTLWDIPDKLNYGFREGFDAHIGINVFGMCDRIQRPCSYFTVMRRPLDRAISSYFHCRQSLSDPHCSAVNANSMDLRDWVIFQGSVFFRSLLFNSYHCEHKVNVSALNYVLLNPKNVPCWLKHKIWFDSLPDETHQLLLDYVLDHLETWFGGVGITEDMFSTAHSLESVFFLPFTNCSNLVRKKTEDWVTAVKRNTFSLHNDGVLSYEDFVELQYDYAVQKALAADYKLYKRINDIMRMQKQVIFNNIK